MSSVNKSGSVLPDRSEAGWRQSLLSRFKSDDRGNVAIIFGLMTISIVSLVGGAVDYGRWLSARSQTQSAIDAALLAAGRASQTSYGNESLSLAAAQQYYAQMKSKLVVDDTVAFYSANAATEFGARGSNYIQTPFLNIIGIERLPVLKLGQTTQATSTIAQGGNSGTSIEIGLMLDTTGSMEGNKLTELKEAATDLVDIVVWQDQSEYRSRIGIAPFSQAVNVGNYFQAVTNENSQLVQHTETTTTQTGTTPVYTYPASCYNSRGTLKSSCKNKSQYQTGTTPVYTTTTTTVTDNLARATCVVERTGGAEFTDDVPGPGTWTTSLFSAMVANGSSQSSASKAACPEGAPMVPLTNDKTKLKATIASLVASNSTAGAVGTAWAWYLISPSWGTIFTGDHAPEAYGLMSEIGIKGQPKLQKIAILMTDGAYNYWQNKSATTSTVNAKALSICSGMKGKGIKVYTVGFELGNDNTAKNMLKNCATDSTYFYDATNGDALKAAFRDIALKISALRLSH